MALPSGHRSHRFDKTAYESSIVRRRDREHSARQTWEDNAKYFHDSGIQAGKFDSWASNSGRKTTGNFHSDSMDTFRRHHELEMKQFQINRRRSELAQMLRKESVSYEAELRNMSKDDLYNLVKMREQVDSMRTARDDERQQIADEKLYEHWRLNNPAIRKAESENLRQYVANSWDDQVSDKHDRKAVARAEESNWNRHMEAVAKDELAREAAELSARRQHEAEYREELRRQADETAQRDIEKQALEVEEREIFEEMAQVEKIQQERKETEQRRLKEEHGKVLKRQHTARLLRLSRQVQAELEADRTLLTKLAIKEAEDEGRVNERRETAKADAAWMQKTIEEQLHLEKQREAELEQLYSEEAEREWQRREADWNKERAARERLMQEVLQERHKQLQRKYEMIHERQQNMFDQRAEMERQLAEVDLNSARDRLAMQRERDARRLALDEQIQQQREAVAHTAVHGQLEAAEEAKLAGEMDDLVRIETARLRNKTSARSEQFEPMIQGKRVTWR